MKKVLVTGASGFIAKHIVKDLLEAGHQVRASVRSDKRQAEIAALFPEAGSNLEFVRLDLTADEGWSDALAGVDVLMHTASPFPGEQPDDPQELIRPAVDGTMRALKAAKAAGVERVILTSSVAAVYKDPSASSTASLDEHNWTDPNASNVTAYEASKTLAERAAWDFVADNPEMKLTTVNPGGVLGPALDANYGTSLELLERVLDGTDPMVPNLTFSFVDVRDVAKIHVAAMDRPESIGERYIAVAGMMSMPEAAKMLAAEFPDRKIATRVAPDWLIKFMARFMPVLKSLADSLGRTSTVDGSKAAKEFGFDYIPVRQATLDAARFIDTNS